jgi:hypothetical protein
VSNRQIALIKLLEEEGDESTGEASSGSGSVLDSVPLGTYDEVVESLEGYNTSPDGSAESVGVLYGPGFTVQLPFVDRKDPVMQVLVSIEEDGSAWPVLTRICKGLNWKMLDPATGRTFG